MEERRRRHFQQTIILFRRTADNLEALLYALEQVTGDGSDRVIEAIETILVRLSAFLKKTNTTIKALTLIVNRKPATPIEHLLEDVHAELARSKRTVPTKPKKVYWYSR